MRWLTDENIPRALASALRALGHDVLEAGTCSPGAADPVVLALARSQDRILISFDRDHGDLIFGQGLSPPRAVVYLRLEPPLPEHLQTFAHALAAMGADALDGYFTVVSLHGLRQRPLPETV